MTTMNNDNEHHWTNRTPSVPKKQCLFLFCFIAGFHSEHTSRAFTFWTLMGYWYTAHSPTDHSLTDNHSWILDKNMSIPFLCAVDHVWKTSTLVRRPHPALQDKDLLSFIPRVITTKLQRLGNQVLLFIALTLLSITFDKELKQASKITTSTFAFSHTHPFIICNTPNKKRVWQVFRIDWSWMVARPHSSFPLCSWGGGRLVIFIKVAPRAKLTRLTRVGPETVHFLIPLEGIWLVENQV